MAQVSASASATRIFFGDEKTGDRGQHALVRRPTASPASPRRVESAPAIQRPTSPVHRCSTRVRSPRLDAMDRQVARSEQGKSSKKPCLNNQAIPASHQRCQRRRPAHRPPGQLPHRLGAPGFVRTRTTRAKCARRWQTYGSSGLTNCFRVGARCSSSMAATSTVRFGPGMTNSSSRNRGAPMSAFRFFRYCRSTGKPGSARAPPPQDSPFPSKRHFSPSCQQAAPTSEPIAPVLRPASKPPAPWLRHPLFARTTRSNDHDST